MPDHFISPIDTMSNLKPRRVQPNVCMRCDSDQPEVRHRDDIVDFKGLTLEVSGLADTICQRCGFVWATPGQEADNLAILREAFATRRDEVRAEQGLLTGRDIEYALDLLGLSKAESAEVFGGGPNAFGKYINGEVLQSFAMDRLIRLTVSGGEAALAVLRAGATQPLELGSMFDGQPLTIVINAPMQASHVHATRALTVSQIVRMDFGTVGAAYAS